MTWTSAYRLALRLLPVGLRRKHGRTMEAAFARELGQARARGWLPGALAGAAGVWDVVRRGAYEQVRHAATDPRDHRAREGWHVDTRDLHDVPLPTPRQLLRRHGASFAGAFVALTASLLALFAIRVLPALRARGTPAGTVAEALLLAVPFIAALTLPMAVLVAVLRQCTRLREARTPAGVRRLVVTVLAAAGGVAALALVVTAEIVPRTNARLAVVLAAGAPVSPNDRTMTIGELREAARAVRAAADPSAPARAAAYTVEVQKKLALPAACVILALAGVAIALRVPRGGAGLTIAASGTVFGAYYALMVTGEDLAGRMVVSPAVGMWGANAVLLAATLLALWRRPPRASAFGLGMRAPVLGILVVLLPAALAAQSPATGRAPDGVMLAFARFADVFGSRLVAAFEAIPAARYDYRPTPTQQSVGYIAQHLEDANYGLCERLVGPRATVASAEAMQRPRAAKDSLADTAKARWPKDTLVARLRASLAYCDAALERMPALESAAQANALLAFETDLAEHYSQIAVYMRLLGLVPPSALPPTPRRAVALPASELPRYPGVFQLARGVTLDIVLRDGALLARSNTGGGPVRLWPEGGDRFFAREVDVQLTFTRDTAGAVTGLVLHQYGRDRPGRRVR